jgi:hypothetical protein
MIERPDLESFHCILACHRACHIDQIVGEASTERRPLAQIFHGREKELHLLIEIKPDKIGREQRRCKVRDKTDVFENYID